MDLHDDWSQIRRIFARPLYASIASVDAEGNPHVTPIGSLYLYREPGRAFFFERFTVGLPRNLDREERLCAMAVDARPLVWLRALIAGGFSAPPGVRLLGKAGQRRPASEQEIEHFQRRVRWVRWTRGYQLLWSPQQMTTVREITFERVLPLRIGKMWPSRAADRAAAPADVGGAGHPSEP